MNFRFNVGGMMDSIRLTDEDIKGILNGKVTEIDINTSKVTGKLGVLHMKGYYVIFGWKGEEHKRVLSTKEHKSNLPGARLEQFKKLLEVPCTIKHMAKIIDVDARTIRRYIRTLRVCGTEVYRDKGPIPSTWCLYEGGIKPSVKVVLLFGTTDQEMTAEKVGEIFEPIREIEGVISVRISVGRYTNNPSFMIEWPMEFLEDDERNIYVLSKVTLLALQYLKTDEFVHVGIYG